MDYCKQLLSKSLNELEYSDIASFFQDEKDESDSIEFKSFPDNGNIDKEINVVIRGISAFLNSDGGILIWGAPKGERVEREGKKIKIFKGDLSPVREYKEKDWIINKISGNITPMPIGINVAILQDGVKYIYVFEIQKSSHSPHQLNEDHVYYIRLDGQSKPAPHYLIDALFKKISYPNIKGYIKIDKFIVGGIGLEKIYTFEISVMLFNFSPLQNEENLYYRVLIDKTKFVEKYNTGKYIYDFHGYRNNIDILYFGEPSIENLTFRFITTESAAQNDIIKLILTFGGKKSPAKKNIYRLDLSKRAEALPDKPEKLVIYREENVLYSEQEDSEKLSEENVLKDILERE